MTDTLLVRAAGGNWEELRAQTTLPDGGVLDVFGEDVGPVLGTPAPVLVAACQPVLSTGTPDALCVDPSGDVWIVQLALGGTGDALLPQLMAFGGALTGMGYDEFQELCGQRGSDSLAQYVAHRAGDGFDQGSFTDSVTATLAAGRMRLVAIVRESSPSLMQSMRFLNASGAHALMYEASSFASASVTAIRATAVDVGQTVVAPRLASPSAAAAAAIPAGAPAAPAAAAAAKATARPKASEGSSDLATFLERTGKATDESSVALMEQLHSVCESMFDRVAVETGGDHATMRAILEPADGPRTELVTASSDGSVSISFEALAPVDPAWEIRAELCQGMERLLGADLGEVRKISLLNLTIAEHLMDSTLMDAMLDLVRDAVDAVGAAGGSRTAVPA